jgi:hypothetical protein
MDAEHLAQLSDSELADYLWRRLRLEPRIDPPIADRFGPEPPEQFLIQAVRQSGSPGLRARVVEAIKDNLRRLANIRSTSANDLWLDSTTDQQIASLAFLASGLDAQELASALYEFACPWILGGAGYAGELTDGQFHILRALAELQPEGVLAGFWESFWERGPRSSRGLIFFAWARADADAALRHLAELIRSEEWIDLPATLWALVGPRGPGLRKFAESTARLPPELRGRVRGDLQIAGADDAMLRDLDLACGLPAEGGFLFPPEANPRDEQAARRRPEWEEVGIAA